MPSKESNTPYRRLLLAESAAIHTNIDHVMEERADIKESTMDARCAIDIFAWHEYFLRASGCDFVQLRRHCRWAAVPDDQR